MLDNVKKSVHTIYMKALVLALFSFVLLLFNPSIAKAVDVVISVAPPSTVKGTDLGKIISGGIGIILIIAALAAFIYLIWGGIQWITSGGDKAGVEAAQHRIQAALLGLFIVFAAWGIFLVVEKVMGISILQGITLPGLF